MSPLSTPRWLSGEHDELMTWWFWVRDPVEADFLSGVFSPLTSVEASEKSSRWFWKESCVSTGVRKSGNTTSVTDRHDMTLAVKVALNPNTTNQPIFHYGRIIELASPLFSVTVIRPKNVNNITKSNGINKHYNGGASRDFSMSFLLLRKWLRITMTNSSTSFKIKVLVPFTTDSRLFETPRKKNS